MWREAKTLDPSKARAKRQLRSWTAEIWGYEGTEGTVRGSWNSLGMQTGRQEPQGKDIWEAATHASGRHQGQLQQVESLGGIGGP